MYGYQNGLTNGHHDGYDDYPVPQPQRSPLTKQVNQMYYEIPRNKYANPWSSPPEFLKIFSDATVHEGQTVTFDCVLLGSPRPKVIWLFNERKLPFPDVEIKDTSDVCQLKIPRVRPEHFGHYMVVAENEVGRAVANASLHRR